MDIIYDMLDEISGNNRPENAQARKISENEEENQSLITEGEYPTRSDTVGDSSRNSPSFKEDNDSEGMWYSHDSPTSESHCKYIQGKFLYTSNPEQLRQNSNGFVLYSLRKQEEWLNLDDIDLKTSPSEYPPPSRAPPTPGQGSNNSISGNRSEGAQDLETHQFLEKVYKERLSYDSAERGIYGHQPGEQSQELLPDLIDISATESDGYSMNELQLSEVREKVNKKTNKVTKAVNRNLSMLLEDNGTSTSSSIKMVVDKKGKALVEDSDGSTIRQPSAAVAEMKARDMKHQLEMEEIARAAEELQHEFKKWAAGKQENLRALLSSLQNILEPEFGWQPIPMTDLLDPGAVRKQYKRAALLVHPDKLQQKGASPRQKYIAEQVFGLLKEASRKFNSQELF